MKVEYRVKKILDDGEEYLCKTCTLSEAIRKCVFFSAKEPHLRHVVRVYEEKDIFSIIHNENDSEFPKLENELDCYDGSLGH